MTDINTAYDRIIGSLIGFALGDAVGAAERAGFTFPHSEPIKGYPVADWTVHTDHLILSYLCASQRDGGDAADTNTALTNRIEYQRIMAALLNNWREHGLKECGDNSGHGLSSSMSLIICDPDFLTNPEAVADKIGKQSGGNFTSNIGLLRACVANPDEKHCIEHADMVCSVSHSDSKCVSSAIIMAMLIHGIAFTNNTASEVLVNAIAAAARASRLDPGLSDILQAAFQGRIHDLDLSNVGKAFHVYKCLSAAVYALHVIDVAERNNKIPSFRKVIERIASCGGEADANCAAAGSLLGAYLGKKKLPLDWVSSLPHTIDFNDDGYLVLNAQ